VRGVLACPPARRPPGSAPAADPLQIFTANIKKVRGGGPSRWVWNNQHATPAARIWNTLLAFLKASTFHPGYQPTKYNCSNTACEWCRTVHTLRLAPPGIVMFGWWWW